MSELDRKIRDALQAEDPDLAAEFDTEPSVFEMLAETLHGRRRWLSLLGGFLTLAFVILGVVSAVQFFRAAETRDLLMWAAACILCTSAVSMLKVWYFLEMHTNSLLREIKRLELQVARLAAQRRNGE